MTTKERIEKILKSVYYLGGRSDREKVVSSYTQDILRVEKEELDKMIEEALKLCDCKHTGICYHCGKVDGLDDMKERLR